MQPSPWSNGRLNKLGDCIRDNLPVPDDLPNYDDVMVWYNDLAAEVQRGIEAIDWSPLLGNRQPEITSRPKTIDTLRQKLVRQPRMSLARMQDIAGVRFDAEMTLDEQDGVAVAIAGIFNQGPECTRDLRVTPHSGYRGVHLWLRLEGVRVEVQIRTHLQSEWANTYEAAGDLWGRGIRYDETPNDPKVVSMVEALQSLSTSVITQLEHAANLIKRRELGDPSASDRDDRKLDDLKKGYVAREARFRTQLRDIRYALQTASRKGV